jgi:hypothetical protein
MIGPHLSISALTCAQRFRLRLVRRRGFSAELGKPGLELVVLQRLLEGRAQLVDHGLGCSLGGIQAIPDVQFEPRQTRLIESRRVRQLSDPILARDAVNLDLVGFDV